MSDKLVLSTSWGLHTFIVGSKTLSLAILCYVCHGSYCVHSSNFPFFCLCNYYLLAVQEGKLRRKVVDEEDEDEDNDNEEEEKPLMMTKKRMKIGMVKARSISSLLGQTNNVAVVVGNDNDKKTSMQ